MEQLNALISTLGILVASILGIVLLVLGWDVGRRLLSGLVLPSVGEPASMAASPVTAEELDFVKNKVNSVDVDEWTDLRQEYEFLEALTISAARKNAQ